MNKTTKLKVQNSSSWFRLSFLAAPLFILCYGIIHLLDKLDGSSGPGVAWTFGHILFLIGMLLFMVVIAGLRQLIFANTPIRKFTANLFTIIALVGLLMFIRVIIIDLVVGFQAPNHAAMSGFFKQYDTFPGGIPAMVYELGPPFFQLGFLGLLILLATLPPKRLSGWSPILVILSIVIISSNLDLLSLGAALMGLALLPLTWPPAQKIPGLFATGKLLLATFGVRLNKKKAT